MGSISAVPKVNKLWAFFFINQNLVRVTLQRYHSTQLPSHSFHSFHSIHYHRWTQFLNPLKEILCRSWWASTAWLVFNVDSFLGTLLLSIVLFVNSVSVLYSTTNDLLLVMICLHNLHLTQAEQVSSGPLSRKSHDHDKQYVNTGAWKKLNGCERTDRISFKSKHSINKVKVKKN